MIGYNLSESVTEFGLFQSQNTLVNFLLENFSGVLILHKLFHSWRQESLVGKLFVVSFAGTLSIFLTVFSFRSFEIFGLSTHSIWIMQERICHKLFFNHFHSWHDISAVTLLKQSDPLLLEIDLLLSLGATFRRILLAKTLILYGVETAWLVTVHNSYGSVGLTTLEKRVAIPLDILDYPLGFCGHL